MKKKFLIGTVSLMLLLTGCGKVPKLANGEEVVAEVNGKQFTADELYTELKSQGGASVLVSLIDKWISSQEFKDDDAATSYANNQYNSLKQMYELQNQNIDELILQNGYNSVQSYIDLLKQNYISTEVAKKYIEEDLSEDEIEKYYNEEIFGAMTVRHILITPEKAIEGKDQATLKEEALNKAKDLIEQLNNGADFETLAKENSDDEGTAENGGLYENFLKDDTDAAFWKASYDLKDGEYTKTPVESAYGYHIILKVSSEEKPSLEDSREKVMEALVSDKISADSALIAKTWAKIREKYNLNIVETTLKEAYDTNINSLKNS